MKNCSIKEARVIKNPGFGFDRLWVKCPFHFDEGHTLLLKKFSGSWECKGCNKIGTWYYAKQGIRLDIISNTIRLEK